MPALSYIRNLYNGFQVSLTTNQPYINRELRIFMDIGEIYTDVVLMLDTGYSDKAIIKSIPEAYRPKKTFEAIKNNPEYQTTFPAIAKRLCILGLADKAIAEYMKVDVYVYNMWKEAYPEFKEALRSGREETDCEVAAALLKLCTGYEEEDIKFFSYLGDVTEYLYMRKYQPSISAIKLWLEAKQKGVWSTDALIDLSTNLNVNAADLDDGELEMMLKQAGYQKSKSNISDLEVVQEDEEDASDNTE